MRRRASSPSAERGARSELIGEVCHQTSPRRGHAPGEPPLRDASLRSAATDLFGEVCHQTSPRRGHAPGEPPLRDASLRSAATDLFGEVCHQTSPRRGHAPGEPPLRDASLWSAAPTCLERFVTKPLLAGVTPPASLLSVRDRPVWRGLSRRASSPRRVSGPPRPTEVCHQTSPRRGHAPGEPPLRDASLRSAATDLFGEVLSPNLSSPGSRHAPGEPPLRDASLRSAATDLFGEVCHQTSPRRGHAPGEPPLRDASLRSAATDLFGEVCHQTSPRRGHAPGEPPLRDASLRSAAPLRGAVVLRERWSCRGTTRRPGAIVRTSVRT
jgi:hypothetical protein